MCGCCTGVASASQARRMSVSETWGHSMLCPYSNGRSPPPSWGRKSRWAFPPPPSSLASTRTSLDRRIQIGQFLLSRLAREGCQVNVAIEREVGETHVANTAGAEGTYRTTGVGVSADVWRIAGDDVLAIGDVVEGSDLPSDEALEAVVRSITTRLDHALRIVAPPEGALPVVFTPAGLSAVLLPVTQGLSGKAVLQGISPLAHRVGE